jgi:hypothetical protein
VVNSAKLNRALAHVLGRSRVERIKEWAGFGYSLVALARKRP